MKTDRQVIFSNFIWRFLERFGAQGVTLIVSIVLARLLDPEVYGMVALITVITTILQVFIDCGLGTALIQKVNADDIDFSSVFFFNMCVCIILYIGLFFGAPMISEFYHMPKLIAPIRVLGFLLIISGFKNIQGAFVSRNLLFKKYFFATLGGTVVAAFVGITMAYLGFGVWALIAQNLVNQTIDTIILWLTVKWRPQKNFSFVRLKCLLSYSWKLLASSLLDTTWNQLRQLIVGKVYSTNDLAYYNKGNEYPQYATAALSGSIDSILLPVMSINQDNPLNVKKLTRKSIKISSYVVFPMMVGMIACSREFISIMLTDKWLPTVPFFIVFCIVYALYPLQVTNLNAIKAMGRSDYFLKLEIVKKIVDFCIIMLTIKMGVIWLAFGMVIGSIISLIINSWFNKKLIDYSFFEQMKDVGIHMVAAIIMGTLVYMISFIGMSDIVTLCFKVITGILFYVLISVILNLDAYYYLKSIISNCIKRRT